MVSVFVLRSVRPAPCRGLRHRFGEIREQHREPEPDVDLEARSRVAPAPVTRSRIRNSVTSAAPTSTTKITGFFIRVTGFSFSTESVSARSKISRIEQRPRARQLPGNERLSSSDGCDGPRRSGTWSPVNAWLNS